MSGRLASCPAVSSSVHMPAASADKKAITSAQESNLADLVDTRTWTSGGGNRSA